MLTFEAPVRLTDDRDMIAELLSLGRYVLVAEGPVFDPITDSLFGLGRVLLEDFATRAEAEDAMDELETSPGHRVAIYPERPNRLARAFRADEATPF